MASCKRPAERYALRREKGADGVAPTTWRQLRHLPARPPARIQPASVAVDYIFVSLLLLGNSIGLIKPAATNGRPRGVSSS